VKPTQSNPQQSVSAKPASTIVNENKSYMVGGGNKDASSANRNKEYAAAAQESTIVSQPGDIVSGQPIQQSVGRSEPLGTSSRPQKAAPGTGNNGGLSSGKRSVGFKPLGSEGSMPKSATDTPSKSRLNYYGNQQAAGNQGNQGKPVNPATSKPMVSDEPTSLTPEALNPKGLEGLANSGNESDSGIKPDMKP
jgi:hypothetical protein